MAVCPKCKTPLREDFGLETCSGCGIVVFVNDDKVSLQEDEPSLEASEDSLAEVGAIVGDDAETISESGSLEFGVGSEIIGSLESEVAASEIEPEADDLQNLFEDIASDEALESADSFEFENLESDDFQILENENSKSERAQAKLSEDNSAGSPTEVLTSADDFLAEMQLFGEMDSEKFQDAIYFFDIEIASIDSKDVRDEILDILDDSKLNLKLEPLGPKIKNGTLLLPAIPAVKAYIIIQKISHLPCELSWALVEVHDLGLEKVEPTLSEALTEGSDFELETTDEF